MNLLFFASAAMLLSNPPGPTVPQAVQVAPRTASVVAAPPAKTMPHRPGSRRAVRRHGLSSGALGRVAAANASATIEPAAAGYVNAVQVYPFADGVLYHLYASPERVTDVALQPGEALIAVAAGDTARWVIGDTTSGAGETKRTHILVKPFAAGLATNLVITTDRRSYHLALTSTDATAMAALSWSYPQDDLIAVKRAADERQANVPVASGLSVEQLHFNYQLSGDKPAWRPVRAFDDGRQTFIEFPASIAVGEAPPLFIVDAQGVASLVNYRMQGRFYVVDRIFDAAELRLGAKRQQVVRIARVADAPQRRRPS